ncbi:hypothetical protein CEXT_160111 [Caerostris extrusa]|uniref:Uncharacterized protein n=1 Tax=Caerostris extrusa TaxID=172846 RepID=A0AAV4RG65_CAEEX|nr:hypothetical protein CEXT_160111 [Caerostris extrusa]
MSPALLIFQVVRRPFSDNWLDSNGCYLDPNRPCAVCAIPLVEDILDTSAHHQQREGIFLFNNMPFFLADGLLVLIEAPGLER